MSTEEEYYDYQLKADAPGSDWATVTKEDWIKAERQAGFCPKMASDDPRFMKVCATGGFGSGSIQGRLVRKVSQEEVVKINPNAVVTINPSACYRFTYAGKEYNFTGQDIYNNLSAKEWVVSYKDFDESRAYAIFDTKLFDELFTVEEVEKICTMSQEEFNALIVELVPFQ